MLQNNYRFLLFAVIYLPVLATFALTALASAYADVPISLFLRDATATLDGHPLTGMQSNLGVLVWAAAAICVFSSVILWQHQPFDKTLSAFFLWSGVITAVLLLDDLFLFHDDLAYRYLGLDEKVILVGYGLAIMLYGAIFRQTILSSKYSLLLIAGVFFSLSIVIDFFLDKWESPWRIFLEDGFKLLGIASWSGYFIRTCFQAVGLPDRYNAEVNAANSLNQEINGITAIEESTALPPITEGVLNFPIKRI
jgi:hypothetical protein